MGVGDSKVHIGEGYDPTEDGHRGVEGMASGWEEERGRVERGERREGEAKVSRISEEPGREVSRGGVGVTASW